MLYYDLKKKWLLQAGVEAQNFAFTIYLNNHFSLDLELDIAGVLPFSFIVETNKDYAEQLYVDITTPLPFKTETIYVNDLDVKYVRLYLLYTIPFSMEIMNHRYKYHINNRLKVLRLMSFALQTIYFNNEFDINTTLAITTAMSFTLTVLYSLNYDLSAEFDFKNALNFSTEIIYLPMVYVVDPLILTLRTNLIMLPQTIYVNKIATSLNILLKEIRLFKDLAGLYFYDLSGLTFSELAYK